MCSCVCMCVCSCVLAFYDPIWPPSVAYVFSLPSSISLSRALFLWLWFCVGFMNYIDFYAVAYYFSLLFLFVYFFLLLCLLFALFSASHAALPFLAVIKMSFYMSEGDIWLEDLPGIMLLARACLEFFSPASPYEYFRLSSPRLSVTFMLGSAGVHYSRILYTHTYTDVCM